jgi:outer membrane protein
MKVADQISPALLVSTIALFSLFPITVSADWGLGASMETTHSMYKKNSSSSNNTEVRIEATPNIEYRGERVTFHEGTLSYAVIKSDKYAIDVLTTSKNRGYNAKNRDIFKGMKARKDSFDLGVRLRADTPYVPISLLVTKDVYKAKGTEVGLSLGGIKPSRRHWTGQRSVSVAPILGANWQDKKGVDYYYGVNNSEVTATRKAYKGKAAITPFVGLELEAKLSKHFSLIGGAKYKHLPTAITESPLTKDKKGDYHVNVGLTYWF